MENRGRFTEAFSRERLELVFGKDRVFGNVDVYESKGKRVGEIDVLVLFANRAIVLQAKSKKLTLEARKGNDLQIKDDFKKSVQDAYDQGLTCASLLSDEGYRFVVGATGKEIAPGKLKEVFLFCVVSDHYPALSFQARQFLALQSSDAITAPFVMDVFTLDAMTEMLQSPLRFLAYVKQRTYYADRILATHELTVLSYHLKHNLWLEQGTDMFMLHDDISADLDVAMAARRGGVPGKTTPAGILTRLRNTPVGTLLEDIERVADPGTIDLGFMLLTLSEDTVIRIGDAIKKIAAATRRDRKSHDLTVPMRDEGTGLTIHCNDNPFPRAGASLQRHCERRKYTEHVDSWFGLCIRPADMRMRFGLELEYRWEQSDRMDGLTSNMAEPVSWEKAMNRVGRTPKIGRNDKCLCGSGRKYKVCCMP